MFCIIYSFIVLLIVDLADDDTLVVVEHDMAFLRRYARTVTSAPPGPGAVEGPVDQVHDDEYRQDYLGPSRDARTGAAAVAVEAADRDRRRERRPKGRTRS